MEILAFAILLGLVPAVIARGKGRSFGFWWFFGTALLIFALPLSLMISDKRRKCPQCLSPIERAAIRCRFCTAELGPPPPPRPRV